MVERTRSSAGLMRSPNLGQIPNLAAACPPEVSLEIFRKICLVRYFELQVARAVSNGFVKCPVYLSIGQESIAAALSLVMKDAYLLTQHRGHSVYLAFGGDPIKLRDELLGLPTGCCRGMGGSPPIQASEIKMIGHEGLIAEHVPIACGVALGEPGSRVLCSFGDGAVEEDYFYGAMGFAATHKLPILFVCEDNDLSVLTPTRDRRNWRIADVIQAIGIPSMDITDDPWLVLRHATELSKNLPGFMNVRTCRNYWHVGVGVDGPPEWDRFSLVKAELKDLELDSEASKIENEARHSMERLWNERLQKLSAR